MSPGAAIDFLVGAKARLLPFPCTSHAITNRCGTFLCSGARDIAVFHGRNFDVQIDAIEQRSGDSLPITLDLERSALAFAFQIAEVSARTAMHCLFAGQHSM